MNTIKTMAMIYLQSENDNEKQSVLGDVREYLESIGDDISPAALLRKLGLSYFCGVNSSSKIEKGLKKDIDTLILYLSASDNAGHEICPYKTVECALICLVESGRAAMEKSDGRIHVARLVKTWLVRYRKPLAYRLIESDIARALRKGRKFGVRLNGTSDLQWGFLHRLFPTVQFYDYTKGIAGAIKSRDNHHVTFSYSGHNHTQCRRAMAHGINVAVPVMPNDFERALSLPGCYNGDDTDLRYMDKERGQLCLLKVKGRGIKKSAFVMDYNEIVQFLKEGE